MPKIDGTQLLEPVAAALAAGGSAQKGAALEHCIRCLFQAVPGIGNIHQDAIDYAQSQQLDLVVWNNRDPAGLYFLPNIIFVECKNWETSVGAQDVDWFRSKIRSRKETYGIFVAAHGISGERGQVRRANEIIREALSTEGIHILVVRLADLRTLTSTEEFVALIQNRLMDLKATGGQFA